MVFYLLVIMETEQRRHIIFLSDTGKNTLVSKYKDLTAKSKKVNLYSILREYPFMSLLFGDKLKCFEQYCSGFNS